MAKRKKKELFPPCLHCGVVFNVEVRWCAKCCDHMSSSAWLFGKGTCDRCHSGDNDEYLARKEGSPARVAAAIEAAKDPKNWANDGAVEAYEKWIASDEYKGRFRV